MRNIVWILYVQLFTLRMIKLSIILSVVMVSVLILNSCSFSSKASRKLYDQAAVEKFDLVIVPGVPFEDGKWNRIMKGRLYWAKFLYDKGIAKNLMFSGAAVYSPYVEGEIMALYARALGIPKENIFAETRAEHSTENIYYSYRKAVQLGFKKIALASDPFQTKMLNKFTREKVNPDVKMIPFVMDTLKKMEPDMTDPEIDYQQAFVPDFKPISKRESLWKRLKGTMGKNLDQEEAK
ncbi:MAG TPA: YdcF family protein [Puia sp.]|nr:YdcF family protein [Puia sp.]